jgi:hypothetical protein
MATHMERRGHGERLTAWWSRMNIGPNGWLSPPAVSPFLFLSFFNLFLFPIPLFYQGFEFKFKYDVTSELKSNATRNTNMVQIYFIFLIISCFNQA